MGAGGKMGGVIMRRNIAVIALLLLTSVVSLTLGCPEPQGSGGLLEVGAVNHPDITSDNAGGAYAVYQVYLSQTGVNQFYLQRISPEGACLWGERGVLIGEASGNLDIDTLGVMADDNGDAIAAWCDWWNDVMYVTKVDSQGEILWQEAIYDLKYASHIVSDGAGGIIYIVGETGLQRRDAEGKLVWDRPGFLVEEEVADRIIASDGAGGAFIVTIEKGSEKSVRVQRIDSEGNCPWSQGAVTIFYRTIDEASDFSEEASARIIADGTGGAFVVWSERDPDETKSQRELMSALRLSGDGEVVWQKRGLPGRLVDYDMYLVTDNEGNALVFWKYVAGLEGQKISPEGELLWSGYKSYRLDGFSYNVVAGGDNGAIIGSCSMYDGRSMEAQIIDEYGHPLFPEAVALSDDNQVHSWRFMMAADGEGGALFAWGSSENVYSVEHSSVQRLSAEGERLWGDSGIRLDDWNQ
jgi:hypothetical protein